MLAKKPYLLLFLCCLLQASFLNCVAQNSSSSSQRALQIFFLKDSVEMEENVFQFNNCTFLYNGPSGVNTEVKIEAPDFVSVVSPLTTSYLTLPQNSPQTLPLRFIGSNNKTRDWQAVNVTVRIRETGEIIERRFWVRMKAFSKWRCGLPQPDVLVQATETRARFGLMLQNLGNTAEEYSLHFDSELAVENDKGYGHLRLAPMESRIVDVFVSFANTQRPAAGNLVTVQVKDGRGDERVLLQKIRVLSSQYSGDRFAWLKAPLSLEVSVQKNGYGDAVYTAAVNGKVKVGEGKNLLLSTQLTNLKDRFWFNNQAAVQYETGRLRFKAGSMADFRHFIINGTGGDAFFQMKKSSVQITGIRSNFGNARQAEAKYTFDAKNVSLFTDLVSHRDENQKTNSQLFVNKFSWQLSSVTSLSVEGGIGQERLSTAKGDTTLYGSTGAYQFESVWKGFHLASQLVFYSKNFPGLNRGFHFHNHDLRYSFDRLSLGAFYQTTRKIFTSAGDSVFRLLLNVEQKEGGIKTGLQTANVLLSVSAGLYQQRQDSASAFVENMKKASASFLWTLWPGFTFSVSSNAGFVSVPQRPDVKPFWAFTTYGSLQGRHWGLNFGANDGPFYYFELKEYLQKPQRFQRIQLSPFYEAETKHRTVYDRIQFTYNRERPAYADNCFLLNQLSLSLPKHKTDVSLLTNLSLSNSRNSFVNVSVRKQLVLPVWKAGDSYSFTLLLYRDNNSNNRYDKEVDEVMPQTVLSVNESMVQTAANGEVAIKNVGKGALHLYFGAASKLKGWMPKDGIKQTLVPARGEKKFFIPFKQSRTVTGTLQFYFDDKSAQRMEPGNIRLTASDEGGNTFSTLTDDNGRFFFNLPAGRYIVSLNAAAFDERFKPSETSKTADLKNNNTVDLLFDVRQKKRQINIRKVSDE